MSPEVCPHCGAEVPRNAKVCPECGSDEQTGWSDSASAENLGLPEENFDCDKFVKEEFGSQSPKPNHISWFWWIVALLVLAGMLFLWFR
jgi:zinc ribbon protein